MDISLRKADKPKKLATAKQEQVVALFNNLFASGFHLGEMISFLERSRLLPSSAIQIMRQGLELGQPFSSIMENLGFSTAVVTQLSLAELHGNVGLSLIKIEDYLSNISKVRKKLIEVATYPVMLLGFLVLIMLGLKNYLLPQLQSQNLATQVISNLPKIFFSFVLLVLAFIGIGLYYWKRSSHMLIFSILAKISFIKKFIQNYLTAYYAREWGTMIGQGLELSQIFTLMKEQPSCLFRELGADLERRLMLGQSFAQSVQSYSFFHKELSLIIEYGEVKSKLGSELEIYAEKTWENFFARVNKAMNIIQPLVFVFVALMIVLLYAAMLLPIYQNMEVHL
ncbi:competence type IV pilus assembly protein ComGB [Streptococcus massiliensis]|uniref:Competence protein comYB n=2 Tax=Streptococcus massiliensis TaxID=313439 RepID=A0A380KXX1_9STRE|nr:competence type IV pilus assembly protein ComGB [Streptococcus massiliensis]SUN76401.1 competence protein comYB [Streptococcus massiliensis]